MRCPSCRKDKPATREHFYPVSASNPKVFQSRCIPCRSIYNKEYRDAERERRKEISGRECDCGAIKEPERAGCSRCMSMDGSGAVANIISALRVLGGVATFDAIASEMGVATRNVFRAIAAAKQEGRVKQVHQHDDASAFGNRITAGATRRMRADGDRYRVGSKSMLGTKLGAPALFILIDKVAA